MKPLIVDNFLNKQYFQALKNTMLSENFCWAYNDVIDYANDEEVRRVVFERSVEKGIISEEKEKWLEGIFDRMLINSTAYVRHRARNVYNDAYAQWWFHVGVKWVEIWSNLE